MKMSVLWSGLALATFVSVGFAHAHLQKSMPADGSVITTAPAALVLNFSEAARLTAAWIQKGEGAKEKLSPLPQTPATEVSVPLPQLGPGTYVVSWRAFSADGHVMPGQLRFTVTVKSQTDRSAGDSAAPH